jgi:hypothetical protein
MDMWGNAPRLLRSLPGWLRSPPGWLTSTAVVLLLAAILIVCVDWLADAVGADVTTGVSPTGVNRGWGPAEVPHWGRVGLVKHQLTLAERDLDITIDGDFLTATYTLTAPAQNAAAAAALIAVKGDAGGELVSHVLGWISVGEFRYGPTGSHYSLVPLTFQRPQLDISAGVPRLKVTSDPFRLFLQSEHIRIYEPAKVITGGRDLIHVNATDVRVLAVSGATLTGSTESEADLSRDGGRINMALSLGTSTGQRWLSGLRRIGGMTVPVVDGLFSQLAGLFFYIVLLWALVSIRKHLPGNRLVVVAQNAVFTVVVALAAIAFLTFAVELGRALFHGPNDQSGAAAAGPVGLLVAGAALVWPVACCRIAPVRWPAPDPPDTTWPDTPRGMLWNGLYEPGGPQCAVLGLGVHAVILCVYWFWLSAVAHIDPFTNLPAVAVTAAIAILVPLLVSRLFGMSGLVPWLVSAGMLGVVLAATIVWPLLYYPGWYQSWPALLVNGLGKWTYLTVAVLAAAGLCVMTFQVVTAKAGKARKARLRQWTWTIAIAAVIGVAVLRDTFANSVVADSHARGVTAMDLFGLFTNQVQLLDWLALALAVVVAMSLPATPGMRPLARRIAIPIGLMLLYWNDTWLYVPVTFTIGLIMLSRLALPKSLATKPSHLRTPEQAIKDSLAAWRRAEFATEQRTALAASSAEALRDHLINNDKDKDRYDSESLANAQNELAEERDNSRGTARTRAAEAFDHRGNPPNRQDGAAGALIGTALGIIPTTITLLTTDPSHDTSAYPVLDFFGSTVWTLLFWTGLGWFVGYFLPLIRGRHGSEKALWLLITAIGATLPIDMIWNDSSDWLQTLIGNLELSIFLLLVAVYLCDIRVVQAAKRPVADWIPVQNWRIVITWSTAILAAVVTAAVTSLATAASNQLMKQGNVPSAPSSSQNSTR